MSPQKFDVNGLRIAAPCSVGWDVMPGDDRKRFCASCRLSVYNVSGMTETEVTRLIGERNGRICMRLRRRADGTVITRDCPVGMRAVRKRVGVFAGATLAAILGLFSISFGQKNDDQNVTIDASKIQVTRRASHAESGNLSGMVTDENGAVIERAKILLLLENTEKFSTVSDGEGRFHIGLIAPGKYSLQIESLGFKLLKVENLEITKVEDQDVSIVLSVGSTMGVIVTADFGEPDLILEPEVIESSPSAIPMEPPLPRKTKKPRP
ncbi:MAG: carboxypeptidase-like regulatory domain-containing protein [Acidobacteriota bacterium]